MFKCSLHTLSYTTYYTITIINDSSVDFGDLLILLEQIAQSR